MAHLSVNHLDGTSTPFEIMGGKTTIGRHADNLICLEDSSVSTHHAEIVQDDGKFVLRDLNSSNGTKINGQSITEAELHDGDVVKFGGVECLLIAPATTTAPSVAEPQENRSTFGSKLAGLGKAAFHETQRNAQLAALKGKIEKLKMVDLNKAHYALGKKAGELRFATEKFGAEYDGIAEVEKSIADKKAGVPVDHSAKNMELLKGAAMSVKMRAEAEGLELKLKQMFVALGGNVEAPGAAVGMENEMAGVQSVRSRIAEMEKEYSTLSGDHAAQGELKNLSSSLAKEAGATGKAVWVGGIGAFQQSANVKRAIVFSTAALIVVAIAFIVWKGLPRDSQSAALQPNGTEAQPKGDDASYREEAQTEFHDLAQSYGYYYSFDIQRKLNSADFEELKGYGDNLYQATVPQTMFHETSNPVILVTTKTKFLSPGTAYLLAKVNRRISVQSENGFSEQTDVLIEQTPDPDIENKLHELSRIINRKELEADREKEDAEKKARANDTPFVRQSLR